MLPLILYIGEIYLLLFFSQYGHRLISFTDILKELAIDSIDKTIRNEIKGFIGTTGTSSTFQFVSYLHSYSEL